MNLNANIISELDAEFKEAFESELENKKSFLLWKLWNISSNNLPQSPVSNNSHPVLR